VSAPPPHSRGSASANHAAGHSNLCLVRESQPIIFKAKRKGACKQPTSPLGGGGWPRGPAPQGPALWAPLLGPRHARSRCTGPWKRAAPPPISFSDIPVQFYLLLYETCRPSRVHKVLSETPGGQGMGHTMLALLLHSPNPKTHQCINQHVHVIPQRKNYAPDPAPPHPPHTSLRRCIAGACDTLTAGGRLLATRLPNPRTAWLHRGCRRERHLPWWM
jgi:hypothetical protein